MSERQKSGRRSRSRIAVIIAATVVAAAMVGVLLVPEQEDVFASLGVMIGNGIAGFLILRQARRPGPERLAWLFVGSGLVLGAVGVLVVGVASTVLETLPAFSLFDIIFITAYGALLVGFAKLPQVAGDWRQRVRMFLDSAVGAVSFATLAWLLVLDDVLDRMSTAPVLDRTIGSMYPFLDVALVLTAMIVVVRRSNFRFDYRMVVFGVGMAIQAFADLSFLVEGAGKSFADASPNYVLFLLATASYLATAAGVHLQPRRREYADRNTPWWSLAAPYGTAMVMVGALLYDQYAGEEEVWTHGGLLMGTLVVGFLVIVRQAIAIQENRVLVEEQRSALVSSISHELRTPLTAMVGFLSLIDDDGESDIPKEEREELVAIVRGQAEYMSGIVTDLVMLAREDPSQMALDRQVVSVRSVVDAAINSVGAESASIALELETDLFVLVDSGRMQQVFVNLVSNSIRYGGADRLLRAVSDGDDLVVEMHDSGAGVPKKFQLSVFQRFERGANKLNAQVQGSGIGLAVVSAVAKAHGGDASYRTSEILGGACFSLSLPDCVAPPLVPAKVERKPTTADLAPAGSAATPATR